MQRPLSPAGFGFAAILFTLMILGLGVVAPKDRYYRWQEHHSGTTRKADWIYERLHFDAAPIDVALIGTSRMAGGLSGPDIERAYCAATGRRIRIANLAIPETGRNMHYVLAKEAARAKAPALFVVELNEFEARRPHNGFVTLADIADVLSAPAVVNANYLSDLARLPGRETHLWLASLLGRGAVRPHFDPAAYQGSDLDRSRALPLLDGRVMSRFAAAPRAALDADFAARAPAPLPAALRPLEHRYARLYLRRIEALAGQAGGDVVYAFLPAWRWPALPDGVLRSLAIERPVIDLGGPIAADAAKWLDGAHVNAWGAIEQSARFAEALARLRPDLGRPGC
jgi:hypothetical protein